jgi:predicted permease
MPDQPPRLAEKLLRLFVRGRDADAITGDLRETFAARGGGRFWFWQQVLSCAAVRVSPFRRALPGVSQDFHYALRTLRRNPGYACTAMLCLALGIGVNTTVFSSLDGIYFRKLPVPDAKRIVTVDRGGDSPCSWRDYREFRDNTRALAGLAAFIPKGTFLDIERVNERIFAEAVSANYAEVLGLKPALGRWFTPGDELPASEPVAVISDRMWDRRFQRDPRVPGRLVRIDNQCYRIVGVAGRQFHGISAPRSVDAWVPLATYPEFRRTTGSGPSVFLIGRLATGATLPQGRAEMNAIDKQIRHESLPAHSANPLRVSFVSGFIAGEARRATLPIASLLLAVVGVVLLIACVNVASLLLSRAAVRRREMATRQSLGASRGRLIRQSLTEGLALAAGGGALGLLFGLWTNTGLASWLGASIPDSVLYPVHLEVNWRVAVFTASISLLCAVLFSLSPALEHVRIDVAAALKSGEGGAPRSSRQRDFYVVAQVALSLTLLIAAGLLLRALQQVDSIHPGFAADHRLFIRLFTPEPDFTAETSTLLYTRLLEETRSLPGVRDATLSFAILGFMDSNCVSADRQGQTRRVSFNIVDPDYFRVMQTPLLRGRNFSASDGTRSTRVVVVNETMARRWWPDEDPIGRTLWLGCEGQARTQAVVIGMARDSKYGSLDEAPQPFYYVPFPQVWWNGYFALIVHTAGDPYSLAEPLMKLARSGGENLRIYEVRSVEDQISLSLWRIRWQAELLAMFGLLAILLAAIGLYGVVAYTVARRTREIGVRMALGAQRRDVQWMVLSRGLRLTAVGAGLGLALSVAATRFLRGFLYGLSPLDPAAFGAACLLWIAVAMLASYFPALRATRIDPVVALRYE